MIQSTKLQQLLLKLLEPCPELTPLLPLSVSLVSLDSQKPLLSCKSKAAIDQDKHNIHFHDTTMTSNYNDTSIMHNTTVMGSADTTENMTLLHSTYNTFGSTGNNTTSGNTTNSSNGNDGNMGVDVADGNGNGNNNGTAMSPQMRIEELQQQLDKMEEIEDADYINANVNPVDNLNILSLMVIRDWSNNTPWQVYSFGNYRLYMYGVNTKYALLLCTTNSYPSALAISRLESGSKFLSDKL